ncbi:2-oxo acid dehydrogenase subunit E2 [Candidatus Profftia tarda]|uniref:Dihydrolipoamide acetyltransferase component of pyruvate dehydrogenase complex n=1 Tax=Candidatus Profftia tarda TaxID=1177216 RepID=A0A8E4EY28_9ENTR|nr:2-oxo acid dehydrogenase subunit E2 [Candidatus Profftia tarda]CAD6508336.1 Dihydrolipoamide acetyltransferase component of pyruvate dehydrogenase complex [Candidatus Profftia tarda]
MILKDEVLRHHVLKNIELPDIGADEVEVTEVMVKVGDILELEQSILTVEGDKASIEIPSPFSGMVKTIEVEIGDKVSTGSLLIILVLSSEVPNDITCDSSIDSAGIKDIEALQNTDLVEATEMMVKFIDNPVFEQKINILEDKKLKTDSSRMRSYEQDRKVLSNNTNVEEEPEYLPESSVSTNSKIDCVQDNTDIHATPIIRRLARELGVNLVNIKGSGRKGRIIREDVYGYLKDALRRVESTKKVFGISALQEILPWPKLDFHKFGETEEVALSRVQQISAANLSRNWLIIPHVTQFEEVDITDLEKFRKQQNTEAKTKKQDLKLTPLVFVMKAVAKALEKFPHFNSYLSEDRKKILLRKYINIGIAVDTPNGLVVPVFRQVNKKGLIELSYQLSLTFKKARDGKLSLSDMQGGCFTISSLGSIGGTAFTPIINAPEVAILGLSRSSMKPVWNGTEFVPRLILPLSMSFDHRVIDGASGARFMVYIANIMSDIRRLIL